MPRISTAFIRHQLLPRIDIVRLIQQYVPLKKVGSNYKCCCPFHQEKTPSFFVSPVHQTFKCFGCGKYGNALDFLQNYKRAGFVETIEELARYAGMEIEYEDSPQSIEAQRRQAFFKPYHDMIERAALFFTEQLRASPQALDYCRQRRQMNEQLIMSSRIGYAPDDYNYVRQALCKNENDIKICRQLGLLRSSENSRHDYSFFRNRIMIPVFDLKGRVIAFGARILDDSSGAPKYINSTESVLFKKGRELYGLYECLQATHRHPERIIVVEGYMDALLLRQFGFNNVVAALGTALTSDHFNLLYRYTKEVLLCFDGDDPGKNATWRALQTVTPVLRPYTSLRVVNLEATFDPDSLVREGGGEAFQKVLDKSVTYSRAIIVHVTRAFEERRLRGDWILWVESLLRIVKAMPFPALQELTLRDICSASNQRFSMSTLQDMLRNTEPNLDFMRQNHPHAANQLPAPGIPSKGAGTGAGAGEAPALSYAGAAQGQTMGQAPAQEQAAPNYQAQLYQGQNPQGQGQDQALQGYDPQGYQGQGAQGYQGQGAQGYAQGRVQQGFIPWQQRQAQARQNQMPPEYYGQNYGRGPWNRPAPVPPYTDAEYNPYGRPLSQRNYFAQRNQYQPYGGYYGAPHEQYGAYQRFNRYNNYNHGGFYNRQPNYNRPNYGSFDQDGVYTAPPDEDFVSPAGRPVWAVAGNASQLPIVEAIDDYFTNIREAMLGQDYLPEGQVDSDLPQSTPNAVQSSSALQGMSTPQSSTTAAAAQAAATTTAATDATAAPSATGAHRGALPPRVEIPVTGVMTIEQLQAKAAQERALRQGTQAGNEYLQLGPDGMPSSHREESDENAGEYYAGGRGPGSRSESTRPYPRNRGNQILDTHGVIGGVYAGQGQIVAQDSSAPITPEEYARYKTLVGQSFDETQVSGPEYKLIAFILQQPNVVAHYYERLHLDDFLFFARELRLREYPCIERLLRLICAQRTTTCADLIEEYRGTIFEPLFAYLREMQVCISSEPGYEIPMESKGEIFLTTLFAALQSPLKVMAEIKHYSKGEHVNLTLSAALRGLSTRTLTGNSRSNNSSVMQAFNAKTTIVTADGSLKDADGTLLSGPNPELVDNEEQDPAAPPTPDHESAMPAATPETATAPAGAPLSAPAQGPLVSVAPPLAPASYPQGQGAVPTAPAPSPDAFAPASTGATAALAFIPASAPEMATAAGATAVLQTNAVLAAAGRALSTETAPSAQTSEAESITSPDTSVTDSAIAASSNNEVYTQSQLPPEIEPHTLSPVESRQDNTFTSTAPAAADINRAEEGGFALQDATAQNAATQDAFAQELAIAPAARESSATEIVSEAQDNTSIYSPNSTAYSTAISPDGNGTLTLVTDTTASTETAAMPTAATALNAAASHEAYTATTEVAAALETGVSAPTAFTESAFNSDSTDSTAAVTHSEDSAPQAQLNLQSQALAPAESSSAEPSSVIAAESTAQANPELSYALESNSNTSSTLQNTATGSIASTAQENLALVPETSHAPEALATVDANKSLYSSNTSYYEATHAAAEAETVNTPLDVSPTTEFNADSADADNTASADTAAAATTTATTTNISTAAIASPAAESDADLSDTGLFAQGHRESSTALESNTNTTTAPQATGVATSSADNGEILAPEFAIAAAVQSQETSTTSASDVASSATTATATTDGAADAGAETENERSSSSTTTDTALVIEAELSESSTDLDDDEEMELILFPESDKSHSIDNKKATTSSPKSHSKDTKRKSSKAAESKEAAPDTGAASSTTTTETDNASAAPVSADTATAKSSESSLLAVIAQNTLLADTEDATAETTAATATATTSGSTDTASEPEADAGALAMRAKIAPEPAPAPMRTQDLINLASAQNLTGDVADAVFEADIDFAVLSSAHRASEQDRGQLHSQSTEIAAAPLAPAMTTASAPESESTVEPAAAASNVTVATAATAATTSTGDITPEPQESTTSPQTDAIEHTPEIAAGAGAAAQEEKKDTVASTPQHMSGGLGLEDDAEDFWSHESTVSVPKAKSKSKSKKNPKSKNSKKSGKHGDLALDPHQLSGVLLPDE